MIRRSRLRRRGNRPVDCREVGRVLQSYLDGEVDADFAALIGEHLEACRDCGLESETYNRIKSSLARRLPAVDDDAIARLRSFGEELTGE